ncbi:hypothetical protein M430DRAFT_50789 [Amorphotheca resinae ATCC 22711]|uniref:Uncharacterized protein n=1 Tax=Amorphotheca resinae ATCC 22711 TaxID=857342 RepID=A0A2T3B2L8_AMORE|nr:hypothetical protein M430DRAFT_50789 [Amorphotheca resinae ATCC 22711]PSS18798.1 hypothetical protein M430DRAFT_50789 [Amorphotheca resinae ATCC 22711]
MRYSSLITFSLGIAISSLRAQACSTQSDVKVTFYGYPDNSPPGAGTAYNCGNRNYIAGGTGTYDDPLTMATSTGEFNKCEIIYVPYLQKYVRYEDECQECDSDWQSGTWHIDIWTGSSTSDGGSAQVRCEDSLTPDGTQTVVRQPSQHLSVNSQALYDGSCHTDATDPNPDLSNVCSSGGSGSGGAGSGGSCSWPGHCAGAPCSTYNDCSDALICSNGVCASS